MLHDREQFDVSEAESLDVGNQFVGKLAIGEPAVVFVGPPTPGAGVEFVNGIG